jgi:hypothetical protein
MITRLTYAADTPNHVVALIAWQCTAGLIQQPQANCNQPQPTAAPSIQQPTLPANAELPANAAQVLQDALYIVDNEGAEGAFIV